MLSNTFFWEHTKEFFDFYRENLNSTKYSPNIIHKTLKKLEEIR
jgi:NAD-dependent deacetylase